MNIVIDTHALLWLLTNDAKISSQAKEAARDAIQINIPTIVLLELLYLLNKKRLTKTFSSILMKLKLDKSYSMVPLDIFVVEKIAQKPIDLEMHDNIIVSTAEILDLPIVTKDQLIQKVYPKTIW